MDGIHSRVPAHGDVPGHVWPVHFNRQCGQVVLRHGLQSGLGHWSRLVRRGNVQDPSTTHFLRGHAHARRHCSSPRKSSFRSARDLLLTDLTLAANRNNLTRATIGVTCMRCSWRSESSWSVCCKRAAWKLSCLKARTLFWRTLAASLIDCMWLSLFGTAPWTRPWHWHCADSTTKPALCHVTGNCVAGWHVTLASRPFRPQRSIRPSTSHSPLTSRALLSAKKTRQSALAVNDWNKIWSRCWNKDFRCIIVGIACLRLNNFIINSTL